MSLTQFDLNGYVFIVTACSRQVTPVSGFIQRSHHFEGSKTMSKAARTTGTGNDWFIGGNDWFQGGNDWFTGGNDWFTGGGNDWFTGGNDWFVPAGAIGGNDW
jgi:hypothetical protein